MSSYCALTPQLCPENIFERHEEVSLFSKGGMIPDGYQAHVSLEKGELLFLRNVVWMMRAVGAPVEAEHLKSGMDI